MLPFKDINILDLYTYMSVQKQSHFNASEIIKLIYMFKPRKSDVERKCNQEVFVEFLQYFTPLSVRLARVECKVSKVVLIAIALYYSEGTIADKAQVLCNIVWSQTGGECLISPNNQVFLEILNAMFDFALVYSPEWSKFVNTGHSDPIDKLSLNDKARAS